MMTALITNMLMCLLGALAIGFIFGYLIARAFGKQKHAIEVGDLNKVIDKRDSELIEVKDESHNRALKLKDTEIELNQRKTDVEVAQNNITQKTQELKDRDSGISLLQMGLGAAKSKIEVQEKNIKDRDSGISLLNLGLGAAKSKIEVLEDEGKKLKLEVVKAHEIEAELSTKVDDSLKREKVLNIEKDSLNSKISLLDKDLTLKHEEALNLEKKVKDLDDKVAHNNVLAETYKTLNLDPTDNVVKQIEDEIIISKAKVEDLEKSVSEKDIAIKSFEDEVFATNVKVKELEKNIAVKNIAVKSFEDKIETTNLKVQNLEKVVIDKDISIKEFKDEVSVAIEKVQELETSVAEKNLKIESVENSRETKVGHFLVGGGLFAGAKKIFDDMRGHSGKIDQKVDEVIEEYKKKNEKEKVELLHDQIEDIKSKKPGVVTDIKTLGVKGASKKAFRSASIRESEINEKADKVLSEYKLAHSIGVEPVDRANDIDTKIPNLAKIGIVAGAVGIASKALDSVDTPEVEIPEVEIPKVELETPEIEIPEVEIPEVKIETPEIKIPEVEIPKVEIETPEIEILEVEIPEVEIPKVEIKTPEIKIPDVEIPKVEIPEVKIETPEIKIPEVETSNIKMQDLTKVGIVAGIAGVSKKIFDDIKDKASELEVPKVDIPSADFEASSVNIVDHVEIEETLINREDVNMKLYIEDLSRYEDNIDNKLLSDVIEKIDPSVYGKNWKIISCSRKVDLAIAREEFLKKVLNIEDSNRQLDRSIKDVCKRLKNAKRKNRVTIYYLLAKKYDRSSL